MKNKMDHICTHYFIAIYNYIRGDTLNIYMTYTNRYFLDLFYGLRLKQAYFAEIADCHFPSWNWVEA